MFIYWVEVLVTNTLKNLLMKIRWRSEFLLLTRIVTTKFFRVMISI